VTSPAGRVSASCAMAWQASAGRAALAGEAAAARRVRLKARWRGNPRGIRDGPGSSGPGGGPQSGPNREDDDE